MALPAETGASDGRTVSRLTTERVRCRSFCFLEHGGERWTAFLITYADERGWWRGYFAFRSPSEDVEIGEIRTADLFVEETEGDVDARARSLGRPLLRALLESALETRERRRGYSPELHRWFREVLARTVADRRGRATSAGQPAAAPSLAELRALYESYRVDQVAHLVALLDPDIFRELVEILLDGRRIDFQARDRFQLAMGIVQDLEARLALPPFEIWTQDYLARPEVYRRYAEAIQRGEFEE
ncbi:MAG: hypothetical protein GX539_05825 [Candidatus Cloacimonetes bacterium]|nr:hypothetical protein [Candidatus Cloacimonadota bacterium]